MKESNRKVTARPAAFWDRVEKSLRDLGIDPERLVTGEGEPVKCVVVASNLSDCIDELSQSPRDHVVMVRVDEPTAAQLDAWVETGRVRSRSEAAALFVREGLKVYASELGKLEGALREVETARKRLRQRVKEVFGEGEADGDNR